MAENVFISYVLLIFFLPRLIFANNTVACLPNYN